jgi:uncharacterized Fe-S cluster-containing radical SAM superfamily protein
MTLGDDAMFAKSLTKYKNLHVRVSIKGCNPEEFHRLTGAWASAYELYVTHGLFGTGFSSHHHFLFESTMNQNPLLIKWLI